MSEEQRYLTPEVPIWLRDIMPDKEFQVRFMQNDNTAHWVSNKGPQTWTLLCPYDEICIGGRRGGSKSAALIAWFAMGDPSLPPDDPARYSYLNEPSFRGLILRKEYQSMVEFVDECASFFRPFGGKAKDDPTVFHFPSGARIYTNHLGDKEAYEKYRGQGLTKIGIEELTQIPQESWYLKLLGSLRNKKQVRVHKTPGRPPKTFPALRCQILSTTNPDGPGKEWVKKRFVKVPQSTGGMVPWNTPMRDPISGLLRIFIPMKREDNPYLRDNKQYEGMLMSQDEITRRQWMDGDWDAGSGTYFCCDDQTEFLTLDGFRRIEQIREGDLIATRGPDGTLTYAPCVNVLQKEYDGDLLYYQTPQVDFAVTPDHRMLCEADIGRPLHGRYSFVQADSLPRSSAHPVACSGFASIPAPERIVVEGAIYNEHEGQKRTCPVCGTQYSAKAHRLKWRRGSTCSRPCSYIYRAQNYGKAASVAVTAEPSEAARRQMTFNTGDWLEFVGWYLSEGSLDERGRAVIISQEKHPERVERISQLLSRLGLKASYKGNGFRISNAVLARYLKQFGHSHQKYIPREYLAYDRSLLQRLFDGLVLGDGFPRGNGSWAYYTCSRQLADDVQELALKLGRKSNISKRKQARGNEWGYYVGIYAPRDAIRVFKRKIERRHYRGMVGCLTVDPYNTILIRRNGRAIWTGNCEFRPDGPVSDDERAKFPQARHVIDSAELMPWWYRFGSGDWGYQHLSVWHKFCRNERDKRLHVYDERVFHQTGSFEMGVQLAQWWLPDLEQLPDKQVTLAISPDAFSKTDASKTKAEQIADGIRAILGPYGALLMRYNDEERQAMARDPKLASIMFEQRKQSMGQGQLMIALKPANTDRVAGWSYIRGLLRWRPVVTETEQELKDRLMKVFSRSGVEAYERELARARLVGPEVLPKMLLWSTCVEAIRGLVEAQTDEPPRSEDVRKWDSIDGVGGDDGIDSLRHGCMAFKEIETTMPKSYYVGEQMTKAQDYYREELGHELTDPTRLAMIAAVQAARYDQKHTPRTQPFTPPRASSSRHRNN